jgi:hypothetical protein
MSRDTNSLCDLIQTPCTARSEAPVFAEAEAVQHCHSCKEEVHNLSALSEAGSVGSAVDPCVALD